MSSDRKLPEKYAKLFGGSNPMQRNWVCILYQDSTNPNYVEILNEYGFSWAESPIHDQDLNDDGEQKKPHVHIVIAMQGKRSFEFMDGVIQSLALDEEHIPPVPIPCISVKNSIRYFTHQDNPEKHQYNPEQIKIHGGFNLDEYTKLSKSERNVIIRQMIDFVLEFKLTEFAELLYYSQKMEPLWFEVLTTNGSYVMKEFLKSVRHGGVTDFMKEVIQIENKSNLICDKDGVILDNEIKE